MIEDKFEKRPKKRRCLTQVSTS